MPGEPRQGSSRREVSSVAAASVIKYSGVAQELDGRMNPEKRTWDRRGMEFLGGAAATVGVKLVEKFIDEAFERGKKGWEPEASKPQESWMKEDFQKLIQEMKAMREDLQKRQEYTNWLFQLLREDLNKEQDRKMKKMAKAQESKMDKEFQQLRQRIQTLEQELHGRQGSKQHSLQLLGAETEMEHGVLIESASEDEGSDTDA
ncbi:uncharacterized protein LOC116779904 isoform X2 [Chiroxiphia lanceolata]|uniref:uncharacterized protein LOC116779904 isoform X2 n=1 Tax=Chiroxiphia lanceolata TaxID=296741 RepID=UPI0013CE852B|nr:uncharacterized protein LOC116779904 isoform X2 [Chiroxiphia lanceolata]